MPSTFEIVINCNFKVKGKIMVIRFILITIFLVSVGSSRACENKIYDVVVIGDSQTGAFWAKSYFGNFLAKCLKGDFKVYGRGGTQPIHWISSSRMDKIPTIQRDRVNHHQNIGNKNKVPYCKKRIKNILETHNAKKVLFFFGDNLLLRGKKSIANQFLKLSNIARNAGFRRENCFILTPTFEMEVRSKRNSKHKNLKNTLKVIDAARKGGSENCQVISGVDLMKDSPFLKKDKTLKRIKYQNLPSCLGRASNDNTHYCGYAAKEFAEKVCQIMNN